MAFYLFETHELHVKYAALMNLLEVNEPEQDSGYVALKKLLGY